MTDRELLRTTLLHRLAVARGDTAADLVVHGARVFDVFTGELLETDVAVAGEHIAGLGAYEGRERIDATGQVLVPGLIDAHMHLESTKLMVDTFASAVLPHGTTTVVVDPHEIANVFGPEGIRALMAAAAAVPLDYYFMVSPCVPASPFESGGARVDPGDVAALLTDEPRAIGVAEMMNFPGVVAGDPDMIAKLVVAALAGRHVDGHAPGLTGPELNAYVAAGIRSDHECTTYDEALAKRRLGMHIMLREGSAAHDLEALLPLVFRHGPANCMLCTDDKEPDDLVADGHMNAVVRKAMALGCSPADAVVMATLNPARYHRLPDHGAIAPGYLADLVIVPDLAKIRPSAVLKRGRLVAHDGRAIGVPEVTAPDWMRNSVHVQQVAPHTLRIPATSGTVRVIDVRAGDLVTGASTVPAQVTDGQVVADSSRDIAKVAVVERHRATGRVGLGLVRGFGLTDGALGSTVAHDAHNVVVVGIDDTDMCTAVARLAEIGGGQVTVDDGMVLAELDLPLGGLLSDQRVDAVAAAAGRLAAAARSLGCELPAPFMVMSFLALSVIPELKVTDRGLLDTLRFELVPVCV